MSTKTENYGLVKPDRTEHVNIGDLNANFDKIDAELKKRPIGSEIPDAAFFDLDISKWASVDFSKEDGERFELTDYVDGNMLLSQIEAGRAPRVKFSGIDNTPHSVILNAVHKQTVTEGERTTCSGTASNIYYDAYSNYSLNIVVGSGGVFTIWFAAYPFLTGEGTVKSVNGITPDENGNVEISGAGGLATKKIDYSNWYDGSFVEYLADGSTVVHEVSRDSTGRIIGIGGIEIVGVG